MYIHRTCNKIRVLVHVHVYIHCTCNKIHVLVHVRCICTVHVIIYILYSTDEQERSEDDSDQPTNPLVIKVGSL